MTITINCEDGQAAVEAAISLIFELDAQLSVTNAESEIARLNDANGADVQVSSEVYELVAEAMAYSEQFSGYFDLTLSLIVALCGFYTNEFSVPNQNAVNAA